MGVPGTEEKVCLVRGGITRHTKIRFAVYACVRSFHDWLSRGRRTSGKIPQIWFRRFANPLQITVASRLPPPPLPRPLCSLKVLFWGNHSQMENIRRNRFHLPALLLSLWGATPSPSDISSGWTITERSSITFYEESWHLKCCRNHYNEQSCVCLRVSWTPDPEYCERSFSPKKLPLHKWRISFIKSSTFITWNLSPLSLGKHFIRYKTTFLNVTVNM